MAYNRVFVKFLLPFILLLAAPIQCQNNKKISDGAFGEKIIHNPGLDIYDHDAVLRHEKVNLDELRKMILNEDGEEEPDTEFLEGKGGAKLDIKGQF